MSFRLSFGILIFFGVALSAISSFAVDETCRAPVYSATDNSAIEAKYKKTREKFLQEAAEARTLHPDIFAEPAIEATSYRIDERTPKTIKASGGFLPNWEKRSGTLHFHTLGDEYGNAGTGSYVSLSWESDPRAVMWNSGLDNKYPAKLQAAGKTVKAWQDDWAVTSPLHRVVAGIAKHGISREALASARGVWTFYEYEIENIEGVRVTGGRFADEKEIIARGAPQGHISKFRFVTVRKPIHVGNEDGVVRFVNTRGFDLKSPDTDVEYGPWTSFH
jgi:hypothetical protein